MAGSFFVVPQWQGSSSSRAMHLADGTAAIREDLPVASTVEVPVPMGAGNDQGSQVRRLSSIMSVRNELAHALPGATGLPIVIGGDCGVELAAIEHAARDRRLAVVWFDGHADLNTPESSPSGAFHGMILRTLLGDGAAELVPDIPLPADRVILAGTRAFDPAEAEFVAARGIRHLPPSQLGSGKLASALRKSGADCAYIHIDLDVIDPSEFGSLGFPEPFGLSVIELIGLVHEVKATLPLVGAGIMEFAPASSEQADNDLPTILRIIGALSS